MALHNRLTALLMLALLSAACANGTGGQQTTSEPDRTPTPTSSVTAPVTEPTIETTSTAADARPDPARPAVVLPTDTTLGYWMPMATDGTSVVYADFDGALTTIDTTGTSRTQLTDLFIGESVDVDVIVRFQGSFWAFVQGDERTRPGVSSAAVSPDGHDWERREIGSDGSAARVGGGFATPDAVQYPGAAGVLDASTDGKTLVVSGWTQTDAGAQPTVWTTTDGQAWTTDILPNRSSDAETAPKIATSASTRLVHTLGPFYLGRELTWMTEQTEEDASLVGVDVSDIAGGPAGFVAMASNFGSGPYSFWEFEDGVWSLIEAPSWDGFADTDGRHPYLLADSAVGSLALGANTVGVRAGNAWVELESLPGEPVSVSVDGASILVVTVLEDGVGLIPVSPPR